MAVRIDKKPQVAPPPLFAETQGALADPYPPLFVETLRAVARRSATGWSALDDLLVAAAEKGVAA